ncbi:MAG: hypothetical protein ACI30V_07755 [Muribaculaceae bacterium]
MKVNVYFENTEMGAYTYYVKEDIPLFALFGYGNTPEDAKKDMLEAYNEISKILQSKDEKPAELDFSFHYPV